MSLSSLEQGFAQALSTIKHPSLSSFHLKFYNESPMNQSSDLHSALAPFSSSHDDLSLALHKYSQSPILIDFTLEGPIVISPTLFWPSDPPITPVWPSITNFHVDFNLNTPNGEWYFIRDPENNDESDEDEDDDEQEESSDDSDDDSVLSYDSLVPDTFNARKEARATGDLPARCFRTKPDSEKINPLLVAMARAAGQMPKLERMSLTARLICAEKSYFELDYLAPGVEMLYVEKIGDVKKPRLYWHVGKWRPDEEVLRLWREGKGVEQEILVSFLEY